VSELGFTDWVASPREHERVGLRGLARCGVCAALWIVGGLLFGLCMAITLPNLFGDRSLTVMSGSMEPTLRVGDVVIVDQISPLNARIGDVVTFRDPSEPTRLVTHRIRKITIANGVVRFVTKGDANTSIEHWGIPTNGTIGRVVYRVPKIGRALFWIRGRFGRLMLVVIPALLLGAYELWRIWRPTREESGEPGEVKADAIA
jgi:signal peptidase